MPISQDTEISFLIELYQMTDGDTSVQKSMFEIGEAIGLPKEEAGKLAEEVIGRGWAEVKTLSGGIGITAEGIDAARLHGISGTGSAGARLGTGPTLNEQDRQIVEQLLDVTRSAVAAAKSNYDHIEEMVTDIKTIEVQLLSPRPKTAVVKAVLDGMCATLSGMGSKEIAERIEQLIG